MTKLSTKRTALSLEYHAAIFCLHESTDQEVFAAYYCSWPKWVYLWYCSLENKICHIQLCAVGGLYRDYSDTRVGVWPLKGEVNLQPILVVRSNWGDSCRKQKKQQTYRIWRSFSTSQNTFTLPQTQTLLKIKHTPSSCSSVSATLHFPIPPFFTTPCFLFSWMLWHLRLRIYMSLTCSNIIEERLWWKSIKQERRLCYLGRRGRYRRTYKKRWRIIT